jgi:hypothetical protein
MQRHDQLQPARAMTGLVGLILLSGSALFAEAARAHMATIGHICGAQAPHCAACSAAAGMGLAAMLAFAAAFRPQRRALRISART